MNHENIQQLLKENQVTMDELLASDLVSVSAFAILHGVHKHTVLNWIHAGRIPFKESFHGKYIRYWIPATAVPPMHKNVSHP